MRPQGSQISLIELADLDFHQLDFSFVVLDDFLDFPLEFLVVGLDILQSNFFVGLEFLVQVDQSLDFGLLGLDDFFQTVDVGVIEPDETCFLVSGVLP